MQKKHSKYTPAIEFSSCVCFCVGDHFHRSSYLLCYPSFHVHEDIIHSNSIYSCSMALKMAAVYCYRQKFGQEKDVEIQHQDLNLGFLNASELLLPNEPLELWHSSRGQVNIRYKSIDTVQFSASSFFLPCMLSAKAFTIIIEYEDTSYRSPVNWVSVATFPSGAPCLDQLQ